MSTAAYALHLEALDDDAFEEWLCLYFQEVYGLALPPQRNGRSGQAQNGVDVMFSNTAGEWVGVQAKAYTRTQLTPVKFDREVQAAHGFRPPLTHYVVCTLNDRDATLQAHARAATIHALSNVKVLALQDLAEEASRCPQLARALLQHASPSYLEEMRQLLVGTATPTVAATAPEAGTVVGDVTLRAIGAWTDAGNPERTLEELSQYAGTADRSEQLLVEVRARFALGQLETILEIVQGEIQLSSPSASVIAFGAHAAQLHGDVPLADAWLARALATVNATTKPQVVGSYVRVHALREDSPFTALEAFATDALGDPLPIALALADAAFQFGELDSAITWYGRARSRQPDWPPGARANELGARIWQLIRAQESGATVIEALSECTTQLAVLLADPAIQSPGLRLPMLVNLGHARRALSDFAAAAAAWEEALAFPDAPASLWLYRCALSAIVGVPLPPEALIKRWTDSHRASLILASAFTLQGDATRATALIDHVFADPAATAEDLVLAHIERVRVESSGQDNRVTPAHVDTLLGLMNRNEPSLPLFAWLVGNFAAAGPDQGEAVRKAITELAPLLAIDSTQRLALAEDLLRADLDEAAIGWLPDIEHEAWPDRGPVTQLTGALVLLRIFSKTFRWADARQLVDQLKVQFPCDANVLLHCAQALHRAGNRVGAYELLTDTVSHGVHDGALIGTWAHLGVSLGRRRDAHRLLSSLQIAPRSPHEYGQLLRARAILGINDDDGLTLTPAMQVTPENAGAVFTSGLLSRGARPARVAFGRIAHIEISQNGGERFNEHVLLLEEPGNGLPGARALDSHHFPWITELLGALPGESRTLSCPPFSGAQAAIIDVVGANRWSVLQAAQMVHLLPSATTGVETFSADIEALRERLSQQATAHRQARHGALSSATERGSGIALIAKASGVSPRALLRKNVPWVPAGHSGTTEDINADDRALVESTRLILDPISLLLLVDIGAESLLGALPSKAVMTPQAVWQLFDWWYEHERHQRGTRAHVTMMEDGRMVWIPLTAAERRDTREFWFRVKQSVEMYIEQIEAPPLSNVELKRCVTLLGSPTVSGIALAAAQGWAYLTEEAMMRAVTVHIGQAKVCSVHRLIAAGTSLGWWSASRGVMLLATLIRHGWSWISFPVTMLATACRLQKVERGDIPNLLLSRIKMGDPTVGVQTIFALLRDLDRGVYRDVAQGRLRNFAIDCLPGGHSSIQRAAIARAFTSLHPQAIHKASRRRVAMWAATGRASG